MLRRTIVTELFPKAEMRARTVVPCTAVLTN